MVGHLCAPAAPAVLSRRSTHGSPARGPAWQAAPAGRAHPRSHFRGRLRHHARRRPAALTDNPVSFEWLEVRGALNFYSSWGAVGRCHALIGFALSLLVVTIPGDLQTALGEGMGGLTASAVPGNDGSFCAANTARRVRTEVEGRRESGKLKTKNYLVMRIIEYSSNKKLKSS